MGKNSKNESSIKVEGSKTEFDTLRENLSHKSLGILSENIDAEYPQKIFEIGKVFSFEKGKISEKDNLCIAISPGNFTEIKQNLEYLFRMLDIKNIGISEPLETKTHFIEGRLAEIRLNNQIIGQMGEVHPRILGNWKIKMPVALLEISLEEVFDSLKKG